jgi:hypothetical protein
MPVGVMPMVVLGLHVVESPVVNPAPLNHRNREQPSSFHHARIAAIPGQFLYETAPNLFFRGPETRQVGVLWGFYRNSIITSILLYDII